MALPVHYMTVLQLPRWAIKDIERKCRGFLWKGQEEISGGHCLVSWRKVCSPIEKGGLGVKDLNLFGQALRLKWLAKSLEQKDRPWTLATFRPGSDVEEIFRSVAEHIIGDGVNTQFWTDNWTGKGCFAWRWPVLFSHVSRAKLTVADALIANRWVRRLQGALSNEALGEFFQLWDEVHDVSLQQMAKTIKWKLTVDGNFSVASAYDLFFIATEDCSYGDTLWHSRVPSRVRFFMWIALKGRCLTADNLAKRNWPHDAICSLCQHENEDCHYLLVSCDYTAAVWRKLRRWCNINIAIPAEDGMPLADWWIATRRRFQNTYRTDFDSLLMLICWLIWKERNTRIFQHIAKSVDRLADDINEEIAIWRAAGIFSQASE
ncbi:Os12g0428401 [Oryza sativa Japonica Group]|uniref:Os12g0428401 protein n=1 Tax=Oryza sativa subsp. japonica TaxID=39947 RepID=A0A0N7KTY7_ORYSJ|nr:Os12g0428401 [Oryza sativa Japonica Group]